MQNAQEDNTLTLLTFFKALADENRLKIVGLLAEHSRTSEQIAAALGISPSTASHHLGVLARAQLVSAKPDGHYYHYSLQTDELRKLSEKVLAPGAFPQPNPEPQTSSEAFEQKVLHSFINNEGRIHTFPAQEKKLIVLLRHCVQAFEPGKRYPEKQVNQILSQFNDDTAFLRRSFIMYKLMQREGGGGEYWRLETSEQP